jgi:hypothetical protein
VSTDLSIALRDQLFLRARVRPDQVRPGQAKAKIRQAVSQEDRQTSPEPADEGRSLKKRRRRRRRRRFEVRQMEEGAEAWLPGGGGGAGCGAMRCDATRWLRDVEKTSGLEGLKMALEGRA